MKPISPRRNNRSSHKLARRPPKTSQKPASFVLGRKTWTKISAVEGIELSKEAKAMFAEFDRLGLSPAERREQIIKKYSRAKNKRESE
jgi:hypothetical protein